MTDKTFFRIKFILKLIAFPAILGLMLVWIPLWFAIAGDKEDFLETWESFKQGFFFWNSKL